MSDGAFIRDDFFGRDPRLRKMVEHLSDDQLTKLSRGGHDYRKVYAAFKAAREHVGQPTVILAQTIKGWTLGKDFEARNATHQMKKLTKAELKAFRDRLYLEISDKDLEGDLPPYYHPGKDSDEIQYMLERRRALGGFLPCRVDRSKPLQLPGDKPYEQFRKGSGKQQVATTMAFVRLLKDLMKDKNIGARFVPIVPDEARTFGLDSMFPTAKIYSPHGQRYDPVDAEMLLSYKEDTRGQILHEGISEAGSMASVIAAGTSYATHGEPMIPVYIFYSMFGFQRTGDLMWAAGDQLTRGFLLGATAGRTTLNGEGLQHEDGHSMLLASTNPACISYDPAFAYEIAVIVRAALERKSAPDTFTETGFTAPARQNLQQLIDSLYGQFIDDVARERKLPPAKLRQLIDSAPFEAERALKEEAGRQARLPRRRHERGLEARRLDPRAGDAPGVRRRRQAPARDQRRRDRPGARHRHHHLQHRRRGLLDDDIGGHLRRRGRRARSAPRAPRR